MITPNIDLGQIIIGSLIGVVGWFIRKELISFNARLDKHDSMFLEMTKVIGKLEGMVGFRRLRQ